MNSIDARQLKKLPEKGIDRYFTWLVKINDTIKSECQLSDAELWELSVFLNKKLDKVQRLTY